MDQVHKETLLRTRVELVKDLDVNDEFCDELLSQGIFTELMIEYIVVSFVAISVGEYFEINLSLTNLKWPTIHSMGRSSLHIISRSM